MTKGNEQQTPKQSSDRWFSCRDFHVTTFRDVLKKWVALEGSCPNGLMLGFSSSQVLNPPFLLGICSPCFFKQSSSVFFFASLHSANQLTLALVVSPILLQGILVFERWTLMNLNFASIQENLHHFQCEK